jgi:cytoskeletal protein RodZ
MTTIGEYLRSAREERKIPLAQVSRDTRVNERYLSAIEAGEFSRLPAAAYAKGFIRIYAEYLGLDPKPLLDQFSHERSGIARSPLDTEREAVPFPARASWSRTLIGVAAAAAIVVAILALSALRRSACAPRPAPPAAPATEELETLPLPSVPTPKPSPGPEEAEEPSPKASPVARRKLSIKAREPVALKVYADGALLFQGTLAKGKEESWTAAEGFDLRVSRPRTAEILLDGTPLKGIKGRTAQNIRIDKDGKIEFYKGKLRAE